MFDISCKIRTVDFDSTLHNLYPRILEKSSVESERHLLFRLLAELGGDGGGILARLTGFADEDDKRYLLCRCIEAFSPELTGLLNRKLRENDIGKCFSVGALIPELKDASITLYAQNTAVDYPAFMEQLRQRTPGGFLGQALLRLINSAMKSGNTDQKIIRLAGNAIVQAIVTNTLSSALRKQGICVELDGISIQPAESNTPQPAMAAPLPDQRIEAILVKALAAYLRHTASEDSAPINAAV